MFLCFGCKEIEQKANISLLFFLFFFFFFVLLLLFFVFKRKITNPTNKDSLKLFGIVHFNQIMYIRD